jgi:DNA-binding NtrC family response regulator
VTEKPFRSQAITVPALFGTTVPGPRRKCVLVFTGDRARTFTLPQAGEYRIGRGEDCEIRIDDPSASRNHARLRFGGDLAIQDLGSSNGTRIGGLTLAPHEWSSLSLGSVVTIGSSSLVVQGMSSEPRLRPLRNHAYLEARLEDEFARAEYVAAQFALIRLRCSAGNGDGVEEALARLVRSMDVIAIYAPNEYEVLLVETDRDRALAVCREIATALRARDIEATIDFACAPVDARTPEQLIVAAGTAIHGVPRVLSASASYFERLQPLLERVAAGKISVLIQGETGVGKEVLAHALHGLSPRAQKPLLCLNCATLSENLLESELFGYERGAFTGAVTSKAGLIESADGGTILLDEVGELPLTTQAKLLRVLEQRQVRRHGAVSARTVDVRFFAATNRDLEAEVMRGSFRADLYFRLNGAALVIPPLRERGQEIRPLAELFIKEYCAGQNCDPPALSAHALSVLESHSWPGNVRELRNVIERAVLLCSGGIILPDHLPLERMGRTLPVRVETPSSAFAPPTPALGFSAQTPTLPPPPPEPAEAPAILPSPSGLESNASGQEREQIVRALEACAGNQSRAAKLLGVSRRTLINRIETLRIARPRKPVA